VDRKSKATVDELYRIPEHGKAEIVHGELVRMAPTGFLPNRAAGAVYASLRAYERRARRGYAFSDNAAFNVSLPHRDSISPDAAFYTGEPTGMKFLEGAPVFAVEVRREGDYGPAAEREIAEKRADYFAAGTLVVWDVDLLGDKVIRVYRAGNPTEPTIYRRGQVAETEPAVPGWTMPVDDMFA
jgi:Uma2 family endonuclease